MSDARVLIERAQVKAQQHKVTYDTAIDTLSVVKDICALKQVCTQSGGLRPFGVSIILAGIDADGPKLFETDPTGIYFQFRATVIGEGEQEIEEILDKEFSEKMTIEEGLRLALDALNKILDKKFSVERIDAAYVTFVDKKFVKVKKDKLERILRDVKKKV